MDKIIFIAILLSFLYTDRQYMHKSHSQFKQHGIWYLDRLIFVESSNKPRATSHKGAKGLMQIMPDVVEDYNTFSGNGYKYSHDDMYDIRKNLKVGIWQLKRLKKYHGGCEMKTVSSYNMGQRYSDDEIYNVSYLFRILGTNRVLSFLKGKKPKSWKGSTRIYYLQKP